MCLITVHSRIADSAKRSSPSSFRNSTNNLSLKMALYDYEKGRKFTELSSDEDEDEDEVNNDDFDMSVNVLKGGRSNKKRRKPIGKEKGIHEPRRKKSSELKFDDDYDDVDVDLHVDGSEIQESVTSLVDNLLAKKIMSQPIILEESIPEPESFDCAAVLKAKEILCSVKKVTSTVHKKHLFDSFDDQSIESEPLITIPEVKSARERLEKSKLQQTANADMINKVLGAEKAVSDDVSSGSLTLKTRLDGHIWIWNVDPHMTFEKVLSHTILYWSFVADLALTDEGTVHRSIWACIVDIDI